MANFMGILYIHTQFPHVKINQQLKLLLTEKINVILHHCIHVVKVTTTNTGTN